VERQREHNTTRQVRKTEYTGIVIALGHLFRM